MIVEAEEHFKAKQRLLEANVSHCFQADSDFELSIEEITVEGILNDLIGNDAILNPRANFMEQVDNYEKSELVHFFKMVPKGALLHVHTISGGCFRKFSRIIRELPDCYVCVSDNSAEFIYGSFHFFNAEEIPRDHDFKLTKDISEDFIYSMITMPTISGHQSNEEKENHLNDPWDTFQKIWNRLTALELNTLVHDGKNSFFYETLKDFYGSGIRYFEMRAVATDIFYKGSQKVSPKEFFKVCQATVELFRKEHPDFIGVKYIPCSMKFRSPAYVHENILGVIELKNDPEVGHLIAGYDLVGSEDKLLPISDYINELRFCSENGVNLILHAGETNDSSTTAMYDAFLLGSKRLGHAYDLVNHPALMAEVKRRDICVESCPISNQCLGYCEDMRNHNARTMLQHGVFLTINTDDPGLFRYWDVSYDWALISKSWGLSLRQIKNICRRSFAAGILTKEELKQAQTNFDRDWSIFIQTALHKYKAK